MTYSVEPHRKPLLDGASGQQMVQFGIFNRTSYDLADGFAGKFRRDEIISPAPGYNILFDQHFYAPERDFFGELHFVPPARRTAEPVRCSHPGPKT
ncbi:MULTISPECIES: hypothetical protein [unclassified Mesorhizobium]|uniref:hypothetical protein n=1 Tax=unclassified Mesorhizobium TaxID=325217 RepID=UPI0013DFB139|nr:MULTISPECIES: hypothetical protein [unclassified Mesorhizobium]